MTTKPKIWACNVMGDVKSQHSWIGYHADPSVNTPEDRLKAIHHYRAWQALELNEVPIKMFFDASDCTEKLKNLNDFVKMEGGLAIVSERFADLLKGFNLGATQLFEIPLFEFDQETQRPGRHFLLNVAETKPCFIPEKSTGIRPGKYTAVGLWNLVGIENLAVLATAADGADMWADPVLRNAIFMSDRLVKAIKAAKIRPVPLKPCNVILPN